jgi:hypothetical protein
LKIDGSREPPIDLGSCWVPGWWLWRGSAEARSLI